MLTTWKTGLRRTITAIALVTASSGAANAAALLFEVDFSGGANTVIGSFKTPIGGGMISDLMVELSGVLFDTILPASGDLSYFPGDDEFTYTGFGQYTNSTAVPGVCAVGGCFLEIYPDPDPLTPGDYLAVDSLLNNIDAGTKYIINPDPVATVPIPAGGALLLSALALGGFAARRKKSA